MADPGLLIVFDTETQGFPLFKQPSSHPDQPHLVQLAAELCDSTGAVLESMNVIIRPDGWTIPDQVAAIHGISTERALAEGIPEVDAVVMFHVLAGRAALRVAHNISFDDRIMRIAMVRAGLAREVIERLEAGPSACTLKLADAIMKLPPTEKMLAAGFTKSKPPNLGEAMRFFFDEPHDKAHDAMADVIACRRIYFHIQALSAATSGADA